MTNMKAMCVKSDPLGWIQVGKVYDYVVKNGVYLITGTGFGLSKPNFKEMFATV